MLPEKIIKNRVLGAPNELFVYEKCPICNETKITRLEIWIDRNTSAEEIKNQQLNVILNIVRKSPFIDKINNSFCDCSFVKTKCILTQVVFCTEIGQGEIDRHYYIDTIEENLREFNYQKLPNISIDFMKLLDFMAPNDQQQELVKSKVRPHYIVFDTETTGKPNNYNSPVSDSGNWPRLVQICWIEYDINQNKINEQDFIIKPNGYVIPLSATQIHKISHADALQKGVDLESTLKKFIEKVEKADVLIGHNLAFDINIIGAELYRLKIRNPLNAKKKICTMVATTDYCGIRNAYGFKYPTLQELHIKLFNTSFENSHNAYDDTRATAKCFWELKEKQII